MMRNQVDTNGLFSRFLAERKKNLKRAFVHLCRQYGSLPGYRTCEPSPWKKGSHFMKIQVEAEKTPKFTPLKVIKNCS